MKSVKRAVKRAKRAAKPKPKKSQFKPYQKWEKIDNFSEPDRDRDY